MTYVAQFLKAYPEAGEDPAVSLISNDLYCENFLILVRTYALLISFFNCLLSRD